MKLKNREIICFCFLLNINFLMDVVFKCNVLKVLMDDITNLGLVWKIVRKI